MESIWKVSRFDVVLHVESPSDTLENTRATAVHKRMLATSSDFSDQPLSWTPDGKAIMYGTRLRGVTNLWLQPIEGGAPKQLTNFTSDVIHSFNLSRDGKQLVFSRGTSSSDVVLLSGIKH